MKWSSKATTIVFRGLLLYSFDVETPSFCPTGVPWNWVEVFSGSRPTFQSTGLSGCQCCSILTFSLEPFLPQVLFFPEKGWPAHLLQGTSDLKKWSSSRAFSHLSPTVVRFLVWTVALTPMGTYFRSRRFRKMHLENILPSPFWARSPGSSWSPWPSGGTLEGI